ncbi:MAG: nuclear transport factor 2 family protein [Actinomycetes bacterium]
MSVAVEVILRGITQQQYDAVRAEAQWLTTPPEGGLSHVCWWEGEDCHNVDAWESEEAFDAFGRDRLGPAMARVGLAVQPEAVVHQAHEVYAPRRVVRTDGAGQRSTDSVELLRGGYEAFARRDIPAVLALFDDGIRWSTPDTVPFGGLFTGPGEVGAFFSRLPEHFAELNVTPSRFIGDDDVVAVLGTHSGRTAAGPTFEIPFVHVWTVRAGKVTAFEEYLDTVRMNLALGIPTQSTISLDAPPSATAGRGPG